MNADPKHIPDQPPLAHGRLTALVFVRSILFGLLFVPIVIAVLYGLTFIEWWRYGNWGTNWIYERGGFPVIGLFAITSASYVVMRLLPSRLVWALLIVSGGTILCWMIGRMLDIMPLMYKSSEIIWHWQRPEFIAWLLIPPWIVAITIVTIAHAAR